MTVTDDREHPSRVRSFRVYDDAWDLIGGRERQRSAFVRDMMEAGLGHVRCYRCFALVPVEFGDLTGKPLAEWVAEAGKAVTRQHREGHRPVTIGNEAERAGAAAAGIFGDAAGAVPSAVFREPRRR